MYNNDDYDQYYVIDNNDEYENIKIIDRTYNYKNNILITQQGKNIIESNDTNYLSNITITALNICSTCVILYTIYNIPGMIIAFT